MRRYLLAVGAVVLVLGVAAVPGQAAPLTVTAPQLVSGAKQFRVPLYQRPYSWTAKEWAPLWQAIREQAAKQDYRFE